MIHFEHCVCLKKSIDSIACKVDKVVIVFFVEIPDDAPVQSFGFVNVFVVALAVLVLLS